jgi:alpha-glucosidase
MPRQSPAIPLLFVLSMAVSASAQSLRVSSPNNSVRFQLSTRDGAAVFEATLKGQRVIEQSPLGITVDGIPVAQGVEFGRPERYRKDERFPWHGSKSIARDHHNGLLVPVKHGESGLSYTIEARAHDDGIAFRFVVPGKPDERRVPDEATAFRLPAGSTVWYHEFEGHYEDHHTKQLVSEVPAGQWAAPPLTFQLPANAGYGSITEGALFRYSGMGLRADGQGGFAARLGHEHPPSYPFRLRYKDEIERLAEPAPVAGTITTPWRVVMMAPDLNTLVNCDIVSAVAPPPDPVLFPTGLKTPWIKPGRSVWRYLDGGENTFEGMKEFSRLASELTFEYNLLEGFWTSWPREQLKDLVEYSRGLGVGIWLWKHSRDLRTPAELKEFFGICNEVGAVGAKIDFFDHEAKEIVELYERLLRSAAEHKILVNFHGANKPTGEARMFPNELTREAIRGMEGRPRPRAVHDATLPFTRMLAGHADYTPVHFGERRSDTTWTHQVATAAVFTSPVLVYGAHPARLIENPAVEIIKKIPSVWDETIVLPGSEIGEMAAFARRAGGDWFVVILNGLQARSVPVRLAFLGGGTYQVLMAKDGEGDTSAIKMDRTMVTSRDTLMVDLPEGGGFIARMAR